MTTAEHDAALDPAHPSGNEPTVEQLRERLASADEAAWRYAQRLGELRREHAQCAMPSGLTAEQEIRARALDLAAVEENEPFLWARADRYAAYITTGQHPEA